MRRLLAVAALVVALAGCIPQALDATPVRAGDTVTITLAPTTTVYSVTLSVLNATTTDERCVVIGETDIGCSLGDLPAGTATTVTVTGPEGAVACSAFGFLDPDLAVGSYRVFACD